MNRLVKLTVCHETVDRPGEFNAVFSSERSESDIEWDWDGGYFVVWPQRAFFRIVGVTRAPRC
jgi:hypothetical protein